MIDGSFPTAIAGVALQTYDVEVPNQTTGQYYLALFFVAAVVVVSLLAYHRLAYVQLPTRNRRHKTALREEKYEQSPATLRIPNGADPMGFVDDIVERFETADAARQDSDVELRNEQTVGQAIRLTLQDVLRSIDERLANIPRLAQSLGLVAILTVILGALAVSIDTIVGGLTSEPGHVAAVDVISELVDLTVSVVQGGKSLLGLFPYGGLVWDLTFAHTILLFDSLYHRWYAVAGALLVVAIAITLLDRHVPDTVDLRLFSHRMTTAVNAAGAFTAIWLAGAIPAVIGAGVGIPGIGAAVGFLCAIVTAGFAVRQAWKRFHTRVYHAVYIDSPDQSDRLLGAYLVARYCAGALLVVAGPLVVGYAIIVVTGGRIGQLLGAIGAASFPVQLTILVATVGAVVWGAWQAREQLPALRSAVATAAAEKRVRLLIFRRGIVALAVFFGASLAWAMFGPLAALPVGVALGAATWTAHYLLIRAKYRVDWLPNPLEPREPFDALVQCYALPTADLDEDQGDEDVPDVKYVGVVGGRHQFARDDPEACAEEMAIAIEDFLEADSLTATFASWHATDCFEYGIVDEERTASKLKVKTHKAAMGVLRRFGPIPGWVFDNIVEKYPEEQREDWLETLYNLEVIVRENDVARIENDIFEDVDYSSEDLSKEALR